MKSTPTNPARKAALKLCDTRVGKHVPGRVTRQYGHDSSGTVEYRFNAQGYRSEEFDPAARFRIVVIGESNAIGTGIAWDQTFGVRLKGLLARALGFEAGLVNLINLSIGGASADYCARTVFRQLSGFSADLVVCVLPWADRIEYRDGRSFNTFLVNSVDVQNLDRVPPALLGYSEYYDDDVGRLNRVKNVLLISGFLRARGIDYVIAADDMPQAGQGFAALTPFLAELDDDRILRHEFFRQKADLAADGAHAGPRSHAAFAITVLYHYGCLLRGQDKADQIEAEALRLMTEDADFRFCTGLS